MFSRSLVKAVFVSLVLAVPVLAQHDHGVVNVSGGDYSFESPDKLETGYQTLTFTNTG
jgi:hypothetical protein